METQTSILHTKCKIFRLYHITEHVAVDDIIKRIKGEVAFQQYIPNKKSTQKTDLVYNFIKFEQNLVTHTT
jgi:hypothetical protein